MNTDIVHIYHHRLRAVSTVFESLGRTVLCRAVFRRAGGGRVRTSSSGGYVHGHHCCDGRTVRPMAGRSIPLALRLAPQSLHLDRSSHPDRSKPLILDLLETLRCPLQLARRFIVHPLRVLVHPQIIPLSLIPHALALNHILP